MAERVQVGLVTIVLARGWTRDASFSATFPTARSSSGSGTIKMEDTSAPVSSRAKQLILSSPRSDGRFHLETIAMPSDMGAFDCERLRKLVHQERPNQSPVLKLFHGEMFDHSEWFEGGIACIGYSMIWKFSTFPVDPPIDEMVEQLPEMTEPEGPNVPKHPSIQRDWYLARGTDMANVWYRSSNADEAAVDIADCEDMLRSVRFLDR